MKRILLLLVFIGALLFGIVSSVPLSFVLRNSGAADKGLGWQQARGTVWHGQVTGLAYRGQPAGAVEIKSSPRALLSGALASDFQWTAKAGRARGQIHLSGKAVRITGLATELDLSQFSGLHPELRRTGGVLKLSNAGLRIEADGRCTSASGQAELDMVRRLGIQYGRDWPLLTGTLSCTAGTPELPLSGDGAAGEHFDVTLLALPDGRTGMDVHVNGLDPQATAALSQLGFTNTGNGYTLSQEAMRVEEK